MSHERTADVAGRMHLSNITNKQLAEEAGYTPEYVSVVLNGHRDTEGAKTTILTALERLTCSVTRIPHQKSNKTDFENRRHGKWIRS